MNRTHRTVWSEACQSFVVAAENAKARGKPSSPRLTIAQAVAAALLVLGTSNAAANGTCPADVVSGNDLSINSSQTSTCTLQTSENLTVTGTGSVVTGGPAVVVENGSVAGRIVNGGLISSSSSGIALTGASTLSGGLTNTGTISGSSTGLRIAGGSSVSAGITNSGTITSPSTGILVAGGGSVSGGITNSGSIVGTSNDAVYLTDGTLSGDFTNSGLISSDHHSVHLYGSVLDGSLHNASGGQIVAGDTGVLINNGSSLSGGITNAGTISATVSGLDGHGVWVKSSTVNGDFNNSGHITSVDNHAVHIEGSTLGGAFINSGTLVGATALLIDYGSSVSGGITNSGSILGTAGSSTAILLREGSTVAGSLINTGTIAGNWDGIRIRTNSLLGGDLVNDGLISGGSADGLRVRNGATISGALINRGTIVGDYAGVQLSSSSSAVSGGTIGGGIRNEGSIGGGTYGVSLDMGSLVSGGITNSGTLTGGSVALRIAGGTTTSGGPIGSTVSGGISNSGTISGNVGVGVYDEGTQVAGGVVNRAGGLITGTGGVAMELLANTVDVGNEHAATISGAINGNANVLNNGLWILPESSSTPNSYVTSNVVGDFTQGSGGTLRIGAYGTAPGEYSQLTVSGTAVLGGTLDLDVKGGNGYVSSSASALAVGSSLIGVINAGSVSGTFASVTDNSFLFDFTAIYSADRVDLSMVQDNSVLKAVTAQHNTPGVGAAKTLDRLISGNPDGDLPRLFAGAHSERELSVAVSQSLPLLTGGSQVASNAALHGISRVVQARNEFNRGLSAGDEFYGDRKFWMKPFGSWADQDDRRGVPGYSARIAGLAFGADATVSGHTRLGLSLAYARADVDSNSTVAPNRAEVDVYQVLGYGSYVLDT